MSSQCALQLLSHFAFVRLPTASCPLSQITAVFVHLMHSDFPFFPHHLTFPTHLLSRILFAPWQYILVTLLIFALCFLYFWLYLSTEIIPPYLVWLHLDPPSALWQNVLTINEPSRWELFIGVDMRPTLQSIGLQFITLNLACVTQLAHHMCPSPVSPVFSGQIEELPNIKQPSFDQTCYFQGVPWSPQRMAPCGSLSCSEPQHPGTPSGCLCPHLAWVPAGHPCCHPAWTSVRMHVIWIDRVFLKLCRNPWRTYYCRHSLYLLLLVGVWRSLTFLQHLAQLLKD